jgi:hypothetical protein
MSWVITGSQKVPPTVWDPNFLNVSLLLHGDGTNGSTTITDSSPSPKTVTAFGNAQISTAQSKFGGASIAFDGTGDYLSTPATSAFVFGTNNFTIELWVRFATVTGIQALYDQRLAVTPGPQPTLYTNGSSLFYYFNNANRITIATVSTNQWYHLAISKQGSSMRAFIDGVQGGSTYVDSTSYTTGANVLVGADFIGPGGSGLNGYIDDLRITKGVARYTGNFTPPTAPFPDI